MEIKEKMQLLDSLITLYNSLLVEGIEANLKDTSESGGAKKNIEALKSVARQIGGDFDFSSDEAFFKSVQNFMDAFKK